MCDLLEVRARRWGDGSPCPAISQSSSSSCFKGTLGTIDICFHTGRFEDAWKWTEYAKARAFSEEIRLQGLDSDATSVAPPTPNDGIIVPSAEESALLVHWTLVGDAVYLVTCRRGVEFHMFKLGISVSSVDQWCQAVIATQEDFTDEETAEDLLSELSELCAPLYDQAISDPDELLILCPTATLFKIPLHAIPVKGVPLLERNPIVYTHSFAVLDHCLRPAVPLGGFNEAGLAFMGNPTADTPAGEHSVKTLAEHFTANCVTGNEATKQRFCSLASTTRLIHFHGHVRAHYHAKQNAMLLAHGEELKAMEVFGLDLRISRPAVILIGCGSGTERLATGDEPIGFISAFLHAGASTVLATLWPISDGLSGAAFSERFYATGEGQDGSGSRQALDFARRLRVAALHIRAQPETAAPYFWAGFVLYGNWKCLFA